MKLIIGLSGNLPPHISGNSFDSDYQSVYRPYFQILYQYPAISSVIYFSGIWYQWFQKNHPEVITLLSEMARKRKQLEFIGGGFYEPVLSIISSQDRVGQMDELNTLIRQYFGKRPRGCVLIDNSWDNSLIANLHNSGIDYIFMDRDALSGSSRRKTPDYCLSVTEDQGKLVTVFPVSGLLFNKATELSPEEFAAYLSKVKSADGAVTLMFDADILKKLGFQWLNDFFKIISQDKNLEISFPSQIVGTFPAGKEFFSSSLQFKNRILDSQESYNLYCKMIFVQNIVHQIRGDKYKKQTALDNLWKGQGYMTLSCSCARGAKKAYSSFIEAEKLSRTKGIFISGLIKYDFRLSGDCQYLYQGDNYNAYLQRKGASIFEFDRAVPAWNYVPLGDDSCSMGLFADYFTDYADDITFSFADSMFDVVDFQRDDKKVRLSFRRKTADFNVMILKSYQFLNTKIVVDYEVVNMGGEPLSRRFMCNFNFNLFCIADSGEPMITDNNFQILDKGKIVSIFSDAGCTFVHRAVTDEMGEYDSSNVSLFWNIHELEPGKSWINRVEFSCC